MEGGSRRPYRPLQVVGVLAAVLSTALISLQFTSPDERAGGRPIPDIGTLGERLNPSTIAIVAGNFLKGIDLGITQSIILNEFRENGEVGNIDDKIDYVTKLFNEEMHVVVRADSGISSIAELNGKKVNFSDIGSGSQLSSRDIFPWHRAPRSQHGPRRRAGKTQNGRTRRQRNQSRGCGAWLDTSPGSANWAVRDSGGAQRGRGATGRPCDPGRSPENQPAHDHISL